MFQFVPLQTYISYITYLPLIYITSHAPLMYFSDIFRFINAKLNTCLLSFLFFSQKKKF
jgi:hypothetical protein